MATRAQRLEVRETPLLRDDRVEREHDVLLGRLVGALESRFPARTAAGRVAEIVARLALERHRQHADDGRERIGPLVGGEPHHAEHNHDADDRGRGRAEPRVHQMHVVEHAADADDERRLLLRAGAVHDGYLKRAGFFLRPGGAAGRERLQHRSHVPQFGEQRRALIAPFEMRSDGDLIGDRQLAIVKGLQSTPRRGTCERFHVVLASRSSERSACRARVRRDFTVPTATPREYAISS